MTRDKLETLTSPTGTTGLAVEPWTKGEIYAVASNWAQASSQVLIYGEKGWVGTGKQVADYRHNTRAALAEILREAIVIGGDEPGEDEIDGMLDDAVELEDNDEQVAIAAVLDSRGSKFSGNNTMDTANDWHDHDFSADEVDDWCDIGVWEPAVAAEFREAGVSPSAAHKAAESLIVDLDNDERAELYTDGDPIYSACNGDTPAQDIIDAAELTE